ncbi:MAG: ORF6N domain-containing protein, partial [Bacillota bacterium]
MDERAPLVPFESIKNRILILRGQKVILDADLAILYGVTTRRLNEQVKRNRERFPDDFMFQLSDAEKAKVVAICDHLSRLKYSKSSPYAFTEHGALMAASVLNSPRAVEMSVFVVRAFVRLRQVLASHAALSRRLVTLEKKYDAQFKVIFDAIRALMVEP